MSKQALEKLFENQTISSFLSNYPEHDWFSCIESLLVSSILSIQKKCPFILSLQQVHSLGTFHKNSKTPTQDLTQRKLSQPKKPVEPKPTSHKRKIPKHLKPVESKIINDVKRDIKTFNNRTHKAHHSQQKLQKTESIEEPKICSKETATHYISSFRRSKPSLHKHTNSEVSATNLLKLADEFLNNPFTAKLVNRSSFNLN